MGLPLDAAWIGKREARLAASDRQLALTGRCPQLHPGRDSMRRFAYVFSAWTLALAACGPAASPPATSAPAAAPTSAPAAAPKPTTAAAPAANPTAAAAAPAPAATTAPAARPAAG